MLSSPNLFGSAMASNGGSGSAGPHSYSTGSGSPQHGPSALRRCCCSRPKGDSVGLKLEEDEVGNCRAEEEDEEECEEREEDEDDISTQVDECHLTADAMDVTTPPSTPMKGERDDEEYEGSTGTPRTLRLEAPTPRKTPFPPLEPLELEPLELELEEEGESFMDDEEDEKENGPCGASPYKPPMACGPPLMRSLPALKSRTVHVAVLEQRLSDRHRSWSTTDLCGVPTPVGFDDSLQFKGSHKQQPVSTLNSPLPTVETDLIGMLAIAPQTLADLVTTFKYSASFDRVVVVDCRYPYEYCGGHVKGAINLTYPNVDQALRRKFFDCTSQESLMRQAERTVVVFHCEFSKNRGPATLRRLKEVDSKNSETSGMLGEATHKHVYLMSGGYKQFFAEFPDLCEPRAYVPMLHERHAAELAMYGGLSKRENQLREQGFHAKANAAAAASAPAPAPVPACDDATVTIKKVSGSESFLRRPPRARSQSFSEMINACASRLPAFSVAGAAGARGPPVPAPHSPVVRARPEPMSCANSPERRPGLLPPLHRTRTVGGLAVPAPGIRSPSPLSSPKVGCASPFRRSELLKRLHAISSASTSSSSASSSCFSCAYHSTSTTPAASPLKRSCANGTHGPSPLSSPMLSARLSFAENLGSAQARLSSSMHDLPPPPFSPITHKQQHHHNAHQSDNSPM